MDPAVYVAILVLALLIALLLWDRVGRDLWADLLDALEDRGWLRPAAPMRAASAPDVSRDSPLDYVTRYPALEADTATDPGLSAGLSGLSAVQAEAVRGYMLDRSRANLIRLAVVLGASTGDLRPVLRGDNGANGQEIAAIRRALGLEEEGVPRTPLAGRPIPPGVVFQEDPLEAEPVP